MERKYSQSTSIENPSGLYYEPEEASPRIPIIHPNDPQ